VTRPGGRLTWIGHSTALIDLDGVRVVTDPLLTALVGPLRRMVPRPAVPEGVDAALVSHLHLDHLHGPSLRRLAPAVVVAPRGAGRWLPRALRGDAVEVDVGDEVAVGPLRVRAVPAEHDGRRRPGLPPSPALGYVVEGSRRVYFPGDTDLFDGMTGLASPRLDLALIPVWGWGPTLGDGHLDPESGARSLGLLRPRRAVPIHWGTYAPTGTMRSLGFSFLAEPPLRFARRAARLAPEVEVVVLQPGEGLPLDGD
jgi:L-ascorbate metabolism protein UlaG (beta-lactamase superfamily)